MTTDDLYAHLRAGACDIAVPVADIVKAVDLPAGGLVPLPRRAGALAGVVEVDGSVVPVVALDRWVALGERGDPAEARIVVLRSGTSRIAIAVDALRGTHRIPPESMQTVCHDAADEELFEAIASATADRPLLCRLEVARLMALAFTWCDTAGLRPGQVAPAGVARRGATTRHALFVLGSQRWAVPAQAIVRIEPTPAAELRWAGQRTCGIATWGGRKLPLVDLAFADAAPAEGGAARRWMVVLADGPNAIGLLVSRGERFLDLAADDIIPTPADELLAGTARLAGLGAVPVLDVGRLFRAVPESSISRMPAAPKPVLTATTSPVSEGDDSHYLVFEADRPYASPVTGVAGVMALSAAAIDDLTHGRRATVDWRGQTLGVITLPSIDGGGAATTDPRIAVIVGDPGDAATGRSAIAVRSLLHWLPARAARRSSMRMPSVGEVGVITPAGAPRGGSLVVVDLAQMAYLLD